jgi:hypothetical protein
MLLFLKVKTALFAMENMPGGVGLLLTEVVKRQTKKLTVLYEIPNTMETKLKLTPF